MSKMFDASNSYFSQSKQVEQKPHNQSFSIVQQGNHQKNHQHDQKNLSIAIISTYNKNKNKQQQLQPDDKNNQSLWLVQGQDNNKEKSQQQDKNNHSKGRGNRNQSSTNKQQKQFIKQQSQKQADDKPKKRGNRQPKQQSKYSPYESDFKKKNYQQNDRKYYDKRQSNSYRGRGRGGYNRDYGNSYGSGNRYNNRNQYQKKDKTQLDNDQSTYKAPHTYNNTNYNNSSKPYNNNNNAYNNASKPYNNSNNDYNNNRYNDNQYNQRKPYNGEAQPKVQQKQIIVEKLKEVQVQKIVYLEKVRPVGRRVEPSVSIFIKGCNLTLTCRRLQKFQVDILVIPYKTQKLQLYPGSLVNSCETNYKQKLKKKGQSLEVEGSIYLQKCAGIANFKAFAFMKIIDAQKSVQTGISNLLEIISSLKEQKMCSIVFPLSQQQSSSKMVIKTFIEKIQNYSFLKDVYITTQQSKVFCQAVTSFNEIFGQLFDDNEISIN